MPHEREAPQEAEDLIDWLLGVQAIADEILDVNRKIERVREALAALSIAPLLDQQFYIDSALVFARSPEQPPDVRHMFPRGMSFSGRLDSFNYLLDYDVPVDSLTVNFREPSVVDSDIERCDEFQLLTLQVPVTAIDTHISLGRAA